MKLNFGIAGVTGRMGRMLVEEVLTTEGCLLTAASERKGAGLAGQDVGVAAERAPIGLAITDDPQALAEGSDAVLDFTTPQATMDLAPRLAALGKIHIIGTTGLTDAQKDELRALSAKGRILLSPNMSLGVNLLTALVEKTAALLGPEFDIEILEMHHRHKVDAPSGTALALGEAAARGRALSFPLPLREGGGGGGDASLAPNNNPPPPHPSPARGEGVFVRSRDGITGARREGEIGFATLRGGDVVGDHTVMFAGPGERIELTHKASSRRIYARGAVRAALWLQGKPPGLYSLKDMLGL